MRQNTLALAVTIENCNRNIYQADGKIETTTEIEKKEHGSYANFVR